MGNLRARLKGRGGILVAIFTILKMLISGGDSEEQIQCEGSSSFLSGNFTFELVYRELPS